MKKTIAIVSIALGMILTNPSFAEDQPAGQKMTKENAQILIDKIKADKKFITAHNMNLTDDEAKAFWPVYDQYQSGLAKVNGRLANLIITYSEYYNGKSLTHEKAIALLNESVAIDADEVALKKDFVPKLLKVLPGIKAARYMQIENKLRTIVKIKLSEQIPLAE